MLIPQNSSNVIFVTPQVSTDEEFEEKLHSIPDPVYPTHAFELNEED